MLLNDRQIRALAEEHGMIEPFLPSLIREIDHWYPFGRIKCISFGPSSFGYDIPLSVKDFGIFRHVPGTVINPKDFNPKNLEKAESDVDEWGEFFIIPGNSYALGTTPVNLTMPRNVTGHIFGKSTYARCGIILNATPVEPGWKGKLTLEFSNSSPADVRVYANEGVAQIWFFQGDPPETCYADRNGKYQNQPETIITSRV